MQLAVLVQIDCPDELEMVSSDQQVQKPESHAAKALQVIRELPFFK